MTEVLRRALRLLIVFIAMWVGVTGTTSVNALFAAPGTDRADAATTLARHVYDIGLQHARAPRLSAINSTQSAFEVLNGPISTGVATFSAAALSAAEAEVPAFARSQYGAVRTGDRAAAIEKSPTCPYCGQSPSTSVDHITSLKQDWTSGGWADDAATRTARVNGSDNLIGACISCNSSKAARELGEGAGQWWPSGWPSGVWWSFG